MDMTPQPCEIKILMSSLIPHSIRIELLHSDQDTYSGGISLCFSLFSWLLVFSSLFYGIKITFISLSPSSGGKNISPNCNHKCSFFPGGVTSFRYWVSSNSYPLILTTFFPVLKVNYLYLSCLEKRISKFPVLPVMWQPCVLLTFPSTSARMHKTVKTDRICLLCIK